MMRYFFLAISLFVLKPLMAQLRQPAWARNAVVYEVNVRQFSPRGTFNEVTQNLVRLKKLGVDVIWLMPVYPIGEQKRKGKLGSYYSVKDFRGVNPEYGNQEDLHKLIDRAHAMGMKVLLDWVPGYTAWDHAWIRQHPDWYVQNAKGEILAPEDWTDVASLNYKQPALRSAMIGEMKYWINEYDVDGFRCNAAFRVPVDFWDSARVELDKIKPVFMLAEMEWNTEITDNPAAYFKHAFNASYGWNFMRVTQDMVKGKKTLTDFRKEMKVNYERFPKEMLKLLFITNHDENSWHGTIEEKYGNSWKLYATLCYTLPQSLPLIYTGEEAGVRRRISFFDKEPVMAREWADTSRYAWYRNIINLRHTNPALWNIPGGENFQEIALTSADTALHNKVYAFKRAKGTNEVAVLTNFSSADVLFDFVTWKPGPTHQTLLNSSALTKNKNGKWILRAKETVVLYK